MKSIKISKGLDLPISGTPEQKIRPGRAVAHVALVGDDYIGMKPTMLVQEGEQVKTGQLLFTDKNNKGVKFTAPGCGTVLAINRGAKRKFESLVIALEGEESIRFLDPGTELPETLSPDKIRTLLVDSGLWPAFRTRPYGKVPAVDSAPAALFVTAIDTSPLAADPQVIIAGSPDEYRLGLWILQRLLSVPIYYCTGRERLLAAEKVSGLEYYHFSGPHPAGLPSTHIHFLAPVDEKRRVWHLGYQDVLAIGHLFTTGYLDTEKIVSLAGAPVHNPSLLATRVGASLSELCAGACTPDGVRTVSGSVLGGREATGNLSYLGRYHNQVSVLVESNERAFLNWAMPGKNRFSVLSLFSSAVKKNLKLPFSTAMWGGKRAIYPLGTYEQVMPLDIIATSLLKALAVGDTDKSKALGCLELIEEDLALCGFVCPGKNEFGTPLRQVLMAIERGD
jgi:Na+-transporting NADH:ubiquinone oxidoreductase subunit A